MSPVLYLYNVVPPSVFVPVEDIQATNEFIIYNLLFLMVVFMKADQSFMSKTENLLVEERIKLTDMTSLLKKMFGRHISADVLNSLIDDPDGMELGGEKMWAVARLANRAFPIWVFSLGNSRTSIYFNCQNLF
ncbi:MAG: hypothetical protein KKE12_17975 [Proteobacteria bacterium]|nr:hypothetical protein [Pseudomonadota bacterium]